jgi:cytochrome c biogenesis protein CcmG, thiol:disulfide interchange protein DsbE
MVKTKPIILLLILLSVITIVFLSVRATYTPKITDIGGTVQDFELVAPNNNRMKLSDMKGSVVFLNFWATWCGSCVEELPYVERLFKSFAGNSSFKMVTILYKDNGQQALNFMKQTGYTFPVYLNPDESASKHFGITGVPETFIIDKKGILRTKVLGPAEWDSPQSIALFQSLIQEP